jgi:hypothetical protein
MAIAEAVLFDAGWIFFAVWSVVLLALTVMAFGKDLAPARQSRSDDRALGSSGPRAKPR